MIIRSKRAGSLSRKEKSRVYTSGMTLFSVVFFLVQFLSLVVMGGIVHEFRRIEERHVILRNSVGSSSPLGTGNILLWCYILLTLLLVIGTSAFFIFQPHLL